MCETDVRNREPSVAYIDLARLTRVIERLFCIVDGGEMMGWEVSCGGKEGINFWRIGKSSE